MKRLWGFRIRLNGLVGNVMRVDVRVRRNQIVVAEVIVLEPPGNEGSRCAGRPSACQCHFQAGCANRRQQLERENASVIDSVRSAGYAVDIALRLMSGYDDASGESVLKMETLRSERERLLQEVQRALNEFDGDRFAGIGRRAAALESQAHDFRRGMERLVNA